MFAASVIFDNYGNGRTRERDLRTVIPGGGKELALRPELYYWNSSAPSTASCSLWIKWRKQAVEDATKSSKASRSRSVHGGHVLCLWFSVSTGMSSFLPVLPLARAVSISEGNRWHTQIGQLEESLIKGLLLKV